MCFRPASVQGGPNKCPKCGKAIQSLGGIVLKTCPFCKADLNAVYADCPACGEKIEVKEGMTACPECNHEFTEAEIAAAASAAAAPEAGVPGAPAAPGAPGAPKAPGAPAAPAAPGAPKAPGAPSAPKPPMA